MANQYTKVAAPSQALLEANRMERLHNFTTGRMPKTAQIAILNRTLNGKVLTPNTDGLAERNQGLRDGKVAPKWRPMSSRVISDKQIAGMTLKDAGKIINPELSKLKMESAADYIGTYYGWNGTVQPEYDLREPFAILDTEVYVKQALSRKLSLMFRNGDDSYEIISDRQEDADYIQHRIEIMEFVMERTWDIFMKAILRNLLLTSNCFVHKLRKEGAAPVSQKDGRKPPVAAYAIIPSHTIQPYLRDGEIIFWRRFFDSGRPFQDIEVDDIIHFSWDVKSGQIFGTPRTVAVRDDIFALRRLEENIELLFVNHLFPLFHVNVGTDEAPCTYGAEGESELDLVKWQIENMPKEGVFVTDERVKIDAVGAEGKSLDFKDLVTHFKTRVYVGLGMSGIDMGEGADGTRATADNISQNLKDAVKADLEEFCGQVKMFMFKEWFLEANYSTSVQKATARTHLVFHELDLDNRIKEETHIISLFNSNLVTEVEARKRLKRKPIEGTDKQIHSRRNLHFDLQVLRLETVIIDKNHANALEMASEDTKNQQKLLNSQMKLATVQAKTDVLSAKAETIKANAHGQKLAAEAKHIPTIVAAKVKLNASAAKKAGASKGGKPRSGTAKKTTQTAAAVNNKMRPTNQHGSNLGPTKAKSAQETFESDLYTRCLDVRDQLVRDGLMSDENWRRHIDILFNQFREEADHSVITVSDGDSYTRQACTDLTQLQQQVAETIDSDCLSVIFHSANQEDIEDDEIRDESAAE